ncbi:MAG TPA: response regulator transcription factor [Bacillota bacterium]|nr:response regulator transcription factor [Bacillota bacterium]
MRVLLAEDDVRMGECVKLKLEKERIAVDWVRKGELVYDYAIQSVYDVIILETEMLGLSGLEVCRKLRQDRYLGGIILLTEKSVQDRVRGLESGADDCIMKPFEFEELIARIRAVGRRSKVTFKEEVIKVADCELDPSRRTVRRADRQIQLSDKESRLLELLMRHPNQLLPRDIILNRVWGIESEISSNNLDAHVRLLRKKLNYCGEEPLIHNVRGIGFKLR